MNTASRIESTSKKNKIQLSEQTAELIMDAGKKQWVEPRRETIFAKVCY
jgi:class 3 adenylate cyclase